MNANKNGNKRSFCKKDCLKNSNKFLHSKVFIENKAAVIIGIKFIRINKADEPSVGPFGKKHNTICPMIVVAIKVIIEYVIATLFSFNILHSSPIKFPFLPLSYFLWNNSTLALYF